MVSTVMALSTGGLVGPDDAQSIDLYIDDLISKNSENSELKKLKSLRLLLVTIINLGEIEKEILST